MRRRLLAIALALPLVVGALVVADMSPAHAADVRDISFPQCGMKLPGTNAASAGVLGANGGRSFTKNPCLVEQLRWAKQLAEAPAFYMNTGNPGPRHKTNWPLGQTMPRMCSASDPNSLGCSYDYGWNSAQYAFRTAVAAAKKLHGVSDANAQHRVSNVDWWLDVEILNSWQTLNHGATAANGARDTQAIAGAINALWAYGVAQVGVYSTTYQWTAVTGSPALIHGWFRSNPVWLAGFDNHNDAAAGCHRRSFTGGKVLLTQYLHKDGFDANVRCG